MSKKRSSAKKKSIQLREAYEAALGARKRAHAPYSKFQVGAAIISGEEIITGGNVENASYGGTVCAERVAIWTAVSRGIKKFDQIVIVTDADKPTPPCGLCLQVMAEFCKPKTRIWLADLQDIVKVYELKELLPKPFGAEFLK